MEWLLFLLILCCCVEYAYLSGKGDLSGMVATLIATRASHLRVAQLIAITGVSLGVMLGGTKVAETIATKLVAMEQVDERGTFPLTGLTVWLAAVAGAVAWRLLAARLGLPTSATHALVGSLCGATLVIMMRLDVIHWGFSESLRNPAKVQGVAKVFAALILSPLVGSLLGFLTYRTVAIVMRHATAHASEAIKKLEVLAVTAQAFSYGMNDAQAVMGVVAGSLMVGGESFNLPLWVKLCVGVILAGGALVGSLRVFETIGRGLVHVRPAEAFSGQLSAAVSVLGASYTGAPVSSTQVISSALVGVGGAWRPRHVRWHKVREILMAWLFTFPCAGLMGALIAGVLQLVVVPLSAWTTM